MHLRKEIRVVRKRIALFRKELAIYRQMLGLHGLLAFSMNMVCRHPKQLTLTADGIKHPLFVRLRTSDAEVYEDILLAKAYDYPISFTPRTVVDAGANCGMTSVFYANRFPDATVVAVEPEASNYEALVRNTRVYPNIIPIHAALWNEDGHVEVFGGWGPRWTNWGKWGFRVRKGDGNHNACRALTLTTLMREVGIESVDILKVDVEGAEREIFSRCDWMDKVKLLAIELHDRDWPGCSDAVNAVTSQYRKTERGLVTFYAR